MLHYALNLELVTLPGAAETWPSPLSVTVALNEVVLIEGVDPATAEPLLEVAATIQSPVVGVVRHWGQIAETLPREELYQLRARIAYISSRQVLLRRLSLGENIALAPCYHQGYTEMEALEPHADLLEHLKLQAHLDQFPAQVSAVVYARALWARELLKRPELILATISGGMAAAGATMLLTILQDYLSRNSGAAAILVGENLEPYYPLGHRLLALDSGQLLKKPILEHRARPLTAYLPLV
jgi:phospholipid/cholesterol/gamma-HCH transport system ATP-binding protein